MGNQEVNNPHIIGLTGSFGSGCSYIAKNILKSKSNNYKFLSLSEVLGKMYKEATGNDPKEVDRRELQDFGDKTRDEKGLGHFADEIVSQIKKNSKPEDKWVVDSIRNPAEIRALREYSRNFYLFGIYADEERRWIRVQDKYDNDRRAFEEDDKRDKGEDTQKYGQRVGECFSEADIVLSNSNHIAAEGNDDFKSLSGKVGTYLERVEIPLSKKQPFGKEMLMTMAFAASQQSSCEQRKVGAIIVDKFGNVISSGFNEVPMYEKPCRDEYTKCYRKVLCEKFSETLKQKIPQVEGKEGEIIDLFRKHFKLLDYCRALHAEENAIINLARNGRSATLSDCVLYTTTYPCRLCANKIVSIGIKQVVYLEPYPDPKAKVILKKAGVKDEFFEGVTFKAYFRIYGEEK